MAYKTRGQHNDRNKDGESVLLCAVDAGQLELVKYLFTLFNPHPEERETALLMASVCGHLEIIKFLHEMGISLKVRSDKGRTPFLSSIYNGCIEVMDWLYLNGSTLCEKDYEGNTAILLAAKLGQLEVLKWLVSKGASLLDRDIYGNNALHLASRSGFIDTLQWLLEQKIIDTREKNINGYTILDITLLNREQFSYEDSKLVLIETEKGKKSSRRAVKFNKKKQFPPKIPEDKSKVIDFLLSHSIAHSNHPKVSSYLHSRMLSILLKK